MREFDLRIPVARWMLARGLTPIMEMQTMRNCDMVGVQFGLNPRRLLRIVAVELKLANFAAVLRQCQGHIGRAHEVWMAMPLQPSKDRLKACEGEGIGFLSIIDGKAECMLAPGEHRTDYGTRIQRTCWRRREEYLDRMKDKWMRRNIREPLEDALCL